MNTRIKFIISLFILSSECKFNLGILPKGGGRPFQELGDIAFNEQSTFVKILPSGHHGNKLDLDPEVLNQQLRPLGKNDLFTEIFRDEDQSFASLLSPKSKLKWFDDQIVHKGTISRASYHPAQILSEDCKSKDIGCAGRQPLSPTLEPENILKPVIGQNQNIEVGSMGASYQQMPSFSENSMLTGRSWDENRPFDSSLEPESRLNWFSSHIQQKETGSKT
ncbi:expressed protein, partial [Phakopsora pachyrhizi]